MVTTHPRFYFLKTCNGRYASKRDAKEDMLLSMSPWQIRFQEYLFTLHTFFVCLPDLEVKAPKGARVIDVALGSATPITLPMPPCCPLPSLPCWPLRRASGRVARRASGRVARRASGWVARRVALSWMTCFQACRKLQHFEYKQVATKSRSAFVLLFCAERKRQKVQRV